LTKHQLIRGIYTFIFFTLCIGYILFVLNPQGVSAASTFQFDFLFCFAASWILRKPYLVPTLLLVAIWFLQDILYGLPLGLWAAIAVAALEFLRQMFGVIRYRSFLAEWSLFCATYLAANLFHYFIFLLILSSRPPLNEILVLVGFTILVYPFTVIATNLVFRMYKVTLSPSQ